MTMEINYSKSAAGTAQALAVAVFAFAWLPSFAADADAAAAVADPHAHHHQMMQSPSTVTRSIAHLALPDLALVRADGKSVALARELDDERPVLVNFIYTTCTTVCPVMTQTFAEVQKRLGADASKIRMISISIDPEEDTPARLLEYSKRYGAGPQWSFYTGTADVSVAVQRAFGVYRGDKMNHSPSTFYRAARAEDWVRLDGFATPAALVDEMRLKLAQH
jgi:protein SCO1